MLDSMLVIAYVCALMLFLAVCRFSSNPLRLLKKASKILAVCAAAGLLISLGFYGLSQLPYWGVALILLWAFEPVFSRRAR